MLKYKLFGKDIFIKDKFCLLNGKSMDKIDNSYINMYVVLTNDCPSSCLFCSNNSNCNKVNKFNYYKFYYIINEINKHLRINKVSFTGGEPMLVKPLLELCLKTTKIVDNDIFTVVSTSGYKLKEFNDFIDLIDSISLSRHHYDDLINQSIYKSKYVANLCDIENFENKDKIHLSCNLIKDFIGNEIEIEKYLKMANEINIHDVGFVSLMKLNKYCDKQFVDFSNINFENIKDLKVLREWSYKKSCRCKNYIYKDKTELYTRYYSDNTKAASTLVFDGEYLRNGFNGEIII